MHVIVKRRDRTVYSGHVALPFRYFAALEGQPHFLEFGDHLSVQWVAEQSFKQAMHESAVFVFCNDDFTDGAIYKVHPTVERLGRMVFFEQQRALLDEQLIELKSLLPQSTAQEVYKFVG